MKITKTFINIIFSVLITISLVGAIALLPENINGVSLSFVKAVNFLILLLVLLLILRHFFHNAWQKSVNFCKAIFSHKITWVVIIALVLLWQLVCVFLLSGTSTWDWMFLVQRATTAKLGWPWPNYLSVNPNNTMLLKLESIYFHLLGRPSFEHFMYSLNIANVAIVDFGTYLIWKLAKKFTSPLVAKLTFVLTLVLFTCVPFFVIPYSDTLSFFLTAAILYTVVRAIDFQQKKQFYLFGLLLGFELLLSYLLKPSLMVLLIAVLFVLVLLILTRNGQIKLKSAGIMLAISIAFLGIGSVLMKEYLYHHNGIVKVDTRQALPMSHFAAMGITGDGDYNVTDMFNSANIKDPEARNKASLRLIKERFINQGGILGYEKFLIHKQIKNSADGSMAWGHEVYYLKAFHPNNEQLEKTFPRRYFLEKNGIATEGKFDFRTVQQIFWIIALVLILGSIFDQSLWGLFLKFSAVGFFAFLLIFEGGRTRYLIQFLPVLFLLASLGMQRGINYVAQIRRNKQG
ncbi:glycosyltransferase family 39 protein [Fructobacillus tropaeoli]|uniref:glycosyltransferase family 39 protein n=1 Tax=Fructobacillus tropaeoli TaxID=709323 RepID=UPI0019457851|nr:glycosyltransferase family 39 protein [Fructobacillus tropaeoli]GIC69721.1 hypothetical protein FT12353_03590 [Fructobacillus tropaeoli]